MRLADLCARFGVGASTGGNKAKIVRDALGMDRTESSSGCCRDRVKGESVGVHALDRWLPPSTRERSRSRCRSSPSPLGSSLASCRRARAECRPAQETAVRMTIRMPSQQAHPDFSTSRARRSTIAIRWISCSASSRNACRSSASATPALESRSLARCSARHVMPLQWRVTRVDCLGDEGGTHVPHRRRRRRTTRCSLRLDHASRLRRQHALRPRDRRLSEAPHRSDCVWPAA